MSKFLAQCLYIISAQEIKGKDHKNIIRLYAKIIQPRESHGFLAGL